jgi:hypothetical protein
MRLSHGRLERAESRAQPHSRAPWLLLKGFRVAEGRGAPCHPDNLEALKRSWNAALAGRAERHLAFNHHVCADVGDSLLASPITATPSGC